MQVTGITDRSTVNGPYERAVLHVQGCTLRCKACFSPHTHPPNSGVLWDDFALAARLVRPESEAPTQHVTVSGGEPFQQAMSLLVLLRELRRLGVRTIVVFTGYTLRELLLERVAGYTGVACLDWIDALIAGRYDSRQPSTIGLLASKNQSLHLFTPWLTEEQFYGPREAEVLLNEDGTQTVTGLPAPALLRGLTR